MARITRKFIADDGTEFATAVEARAHNNRPLPGVAEFLSLYGTKPRKIPEYSRLIAAWDAYLVQASESGAS